jgi:hypothetical protein
VQPYVARIVGKFSDVGRSFPKELIVSRPIPLFYRFGEGGHIDLDVLSIELLLIICKRGHSLAFCDLSQR